MGKRILVRRRGRGTMVFRAPTHRRVAPTHYPKLSERDMEGGIRGRVEELLHEPGRGAPLARIGLAGGQECYLVAPEGLFVGQEVSIGGGPEIGIGEVRPLGKIPEGTFVCNMEMRPGDGGTMAKSSGAYALVVAHTPFGTEVRLPSGKTKYLKDECLAMVGVVAGGGRVEKPFVKAGNRWRLMKARGRKWPMPKATAMVAASHPFGGGRHKHAGRPKTVSRHAPPGRKVGLIAARRTGRGRKSRQ
jgi:large subunit ribosomal protein L2